MIVINTSSIQSLSNPTLINNNKNFKIREIATGLSFPSDMEIIGDDILVAQKYDGKIKIIRNMDLKKYAIHDVPTISYGDNSGLMGISSMNQGNSTIVFLYFTQQYTKNSIFSSVGYSNVIYSYKWNATGLELKDGKLIFEIPIINASADYGEKLETDLDNHLYLTMGDLNRKGLEQNFIENTDHHDTLVDTLERSGAILRIAYNGTISPDNPLTHNGFEEYYTYGIKQVADLTFDPISNILWDIEKRPNSIDEINLIKPGFNSGWKKIHDYVNNPCCYLDVKLPQDNDVLFQRPNSPYDDPKLVIPNSTSLTAIGFMNTSSSKFTHDSSMYIGDMQGNIFRFGLDKDRINIFSSGDLQNNLFAKGFGPIVDLESDEKGVLYILTYSNTTSSPYEEQSGSVYAIQLKDNIGRLTTDEIIDIDSLGILWILVLIILLSVYSKYNWIKQTIKK